MVNCNVICGPDEIIVWCAFPDRQDFIKFEQCFLFLGSMMRTRILDPDPFKNWIQIQLMYIIIKFCQLISFSPKNNFLQIRQFYGETFHLMSDFCYRIFADSTLFLIRKNVDTFMKFHWQRWALQLACYKIDVDYTCIQVLGDLSMTLCDPFAINFLSQSAMKLVNFQVNWNLRRIQILFNSFKLAIVYSSYVMLNIFIYCYIII